MTELVEIKIYKSLDYSELTRFFSAYVIILNKQKSWIENAQFNTGTYGAEVRIIIKDMLEMTEVGNLLKISEKNI